ncbi:MAG TPA: hypothetical protein VER17_05210 [Tepidisphaeraceae bacterium]|nr:hypothetical protein [Tepidisphaeraceae bacterium]
MNAGSFVPSAAATLTVNRATLNLNNGLDTTSTREVQVVATNGKLNLTAGSDLTLSGSGALRVGHLQNIGSTQVSTVTIGSGSVLTTPLLTLGNNQDGSFQVPNQPPLPLSGGTGIMNLSAGGTLTVTGTASLARGTVNMNGGTLNVPNLLDNGNASINWNSGTINLTNSDLTVGGPGLIPSPLTLDAGKALGVSGTTNMASGASMTLAGGAFATANLAVSGTVSSTAGSLSIPGATTVNSGGTLNVNGGTLSNGSLDVSGTLNLGGGTATVAGATTFNPSTTLVLGGGSLTSGTLTSAFALDLTAGSITSTGAATVGPALANAGRINLIDCAVSGTINMSAGAVLNTAGVVALAGSVLGRAGSLQVGEGTTAMAPGGQKLAAVQSVSVATGGALDLADNKLVVSGHSLAAVRDLVASGRNGGAWNGAWNGAGVNTSRPDAVAGLTALGVATAGDVGKSSFGGATGLAASDVLVMYTYAGDAESARAAHGAYGSSARYCGRESGRSKTTSQAPRFRGGNCTPPAPGPRPHRGNRPSYAAHASAPAASAAADLPQGFRLP